MQGFGHHLGASGARVGLWGDEALKSSSERIPSSKLTPCLLLDTSVTMWFLVLCLALSLAGTGETVGTMWEEGEWA